MQFRVIAPKHDGFDQITRDKPRAKAKPAQDLHQKPRGIAAGTAPFTQHLFAIPNPGFRALHIGDALMHERGQVDQEFNSTARRAR